MKRIQNALCAVLLVPVVMSTALVAEVKIGIVKIDDVINPTNVERSAAKEFAERGKALQSELMNASNELQNLDAKLRDKQQKYQESAKGKDGQLSAEQVNELSGEMQTLMAKNQELQQRSQTKGMELQNDFQKKLKSAAQSVLEKENLELIIPADIVLASKGGDVTSKVVAEMNSRYDAENRAKKATAAKPAK